MALNLTLALGCLAVALALRPWRMLAGAALAGPWLATLVLLPWLWSLPSLHAMPLQLQWSGACLVTLMLGWPLAVPTLCLTGALCIAVAGLSATQALDLAVWQGLVPATLALGLGALIRHRIGTHPFVYLLGRAFLGTVASLFAASMLAQASGHLLPGIDTELSLVARWLTAWGDAFVTGMLAAIFVAYRPHWLATWNDTLYLRR